MAEVDWGTQDNQASPKKRVPTWVWIGGGCCGLALLAVIAMVIGGVLIGRRAMNQEGNWESLAKTVPYDEGAKRDDAMIISNPAAMFAPGIDGMWQIVDKGAHWEAMFLQFDEKNAKELREKFFGSEGAHAGQIAGAMAQHDTEAGTIEIQGRTLNCVRFTTQKSDKDSSEPSGEAKSPQEKGVFEAISAEFKKSIAMIDITPEGSNTFLIFTYAHKGSLERVDDGEVQDFLRPYHIGPNR